MRFAIALPVAFAAPSWRAIADYRSVAAIVAALALVQFALGALSVFAPLTLLARGAGPEAVGLVAASYAAGFLLGALRAPLAIRAIGHIRTFAGFAAFGTVLSLGLFAFTPLAAWMAIQAGIGLCAATLLTTGESWIADVAPHDRRGAVLSYYLVVSKFGQICGPLALLGAAPATAHGFMAAAAALAASLMPVCATRRTQPSPPSVTPFGLRDAWATAPAAVMAGFAAGAVNGAVLQLYALFAAARGAGGEMAAAAMLNAALAVGAVVAQWPAGWISDRIDRRMVIAWLAALGAVTALALGLWSNAPWAAVLALAGVWGAGSMSFYGVAVAHAADRAPPGQAAAMMSSILVAWAAGALAGPLAAGMLMGTGLGAGGLFIYAAAALTALAVSMLVRRVEKSPTAPEEKSRFAVAPATSIAVAAIDPRGEDADAQLNLFEHGAQARPEPAE